MKQVSEKIRRRCEENMSMHNVKIMWELERYENRKRFVAVECLNDHEVKYVRLDQLSSGSWYCGSCQLIRYFLEFGKGGTLENFTAIDIKTSKLKVKCKNCQTISTIQSSHIHTATCSGCVTKAYTEALSAKGCVYKRRYTVRATGGTAYVVYESPFGIEDRVQAGKLLSGRWRVAGDKSSRSGVYIFKFEDNDQIFFKIGISSSAKIRLKEIGLNKECNISLFIPINSARIARMVESALHKQFKMKRLSIEIIGKYYKPKTKPDGTLHIDGGTEWFTCANLDEFIQIREEVKNVISNWNHCD